MTRKTIYIEENTANCEIENGSMFSLDDLFKLNKARYYWFKQNRLYLKAMKDPINDPIQLALVYKESVNMVIFARLLKKQRPKRYFARINRSSEYIGPFASCDAAHNRAILEKNT